MRNRGRIALTTVCLVVLFAAATGRANAQLTGGKNPSPELIGLLTKELSITPAQATGGAGALFGLAKTRLNPSQFGQIAKVVPGMDGLLKAAPKPKAGSAALGSMASAIPGGAGGLASTAGAFKALGLSPDMAGKFVPVLTKFVESKGGAGIGSLLSGVLK